jgi:hypothetical protein
MITSEKKAAKKFFSAASKNANRRFLINFVPIRTQFFAAKTDCEEQGKTCFATRGSLKYYI